MLFGKECMMKPLKMYGKDLEFVTECRYLGVNVVSGKSFSTTTSPLLRKFRCSANTILNAQQRSSEPVLMKLVYAVCVPNLTYACDAVALTTKQIHEMTVALNDCIRRIFTFHRWESVTFLRQSCGYQSIVEIIHQRTKSFLNSMSRTHNNSLIDICAIVNA